MNHFKLYLCLLFIVSSLYASAQWERLPGPTPGFVGEAGGVTSIATNDTFVWIGTEASGVFRVPAGLTFDDWQPKNKGMEAYSIFSLAYANGVLVATTNIGIYVSTDYGDNWTSRNKGLPLGQKITSFAATSAVLLAATEKYGVFSSTDNGQNWQSANNGLLDNNIIAVKGSGNTVWTLTLNAGLFKSDDAAQSWQQVVVPGGCIACTGIEIVDSTIFISQGKILVSTNAGNNWVRDSSINNIIGVTAYRGRLVAFTAYTQYTSNDTGKTWQFDWEFNADSTMRINTAIYTDNEIRYTATKKHGIYRGTIAAITWKPFNQGLLTANVTQLAWHGNQLCAIAFGSLFTSANNGILWNEQYPSQSRVSSFVSLGAKLAISTDTDGVHIADNSFIWSPANNGLTDKRVNKLVKSGNTLFALTKTGIFRSPNDGQVWVKYCNAIDTLLFTDILFDGNVLYAGTDRGFYKSTNDGQSFVLVDSTVIPKRLVYFIRKVNGTLWLKIGIDTHTSTDGINWPRHYYYGGVTFATAMSVTNKQMYAATNTGFYFKDTAVTQWNFMKAINGAETHVFAANDSFVFAGTGAGIWRIKKGEVITTVFSNNNEGIIIYPNPAQELVKVGDGKNWDKITLYSLTGQQVVNCTQCAGLALPTLPSGLYIVEIQNGESFYRSKLEITKF